MTVKDAMKVLRNTKDISIGFGDRGIHIEPDDELLIEVYGNYAVDSIWIDGETPGLVEINVKFRPVKEGE